MMHDHISAGALWACTSRQQTSEGMLGCTGVASISTHTWLPPQAQPLPGCLAGHSMPCKAFCAGHARPPSDYWAARSCLGWLKRLSPPISSTVLGGASATAAARWRLGGKCAGQHPSEARAPLRAGWAML